MQGSLIANMVMGIIILRKRYEFSKYLSVLMITAGIVVCTIVSGSNVVSVFYFFISTQFKFKIDLVKWNLLPSWETQIEIHNSNDMIIDLYDIFQTNTANPDLAKEDTSGYSVFFWWLCGISLLTLALFISARMGIYQEVLYKRFGKHPREALYVTVSRLLNSFAIFESISISLIRFCFPMEYFSICCLCPDFLCCTAISSSTLR